MRFLIDAQLPPALAQWLREAGYDAEHIEEIGLREATDATIWSYASHKHAIIVTKDEDFAARAAHAMNTPVIVWLRVGNTTNRTLKAWISPRLPGIAELVRQGSRMVEVI